jgi:hypothetical protein
MNMGTVKECCCAAKYEIAWLSGIVFTGAAGTLFIALTAVAHAQMEELWNKLHNVQLQKLHPSEMNEKVLQLGREIQTLNNFALGTLGGAIGSILIGAICSLGLTISAGRNDYYSGIKEGLQKIISQRPEQL